MDLWKYIRKKENKKKGKRVKNRRRRRCNGATGVKERKVGRRHTLLRMIRVFYFLVAAFTKTITYPISTFS